MHDKHFSIKVSSYHACRLGKMIIEIPFHASFGKHSALKLNGNFIDVAMIMYIVHVHG